MILEKMTTIFSGTRCKYGMVQFCINFMRIITLWMCAKLGIALLPAGCRPIPSGHYNFDPALAREFGGRDGYTKAIIYQYIANWVIYNQEHGKNYADGRFWSYNSGRAWAEMIKLWDTNTIEKHIKFLRDEGILDAKAMKAHKGDQTLWFTIPQKESNGGTQIALPLDSNAPMAGAKAGNDSSVLETTNSKSTIQNTKQQQQPRANAHLDAGGVAQFRKTDLDPKEGIEFPKAEVPEGRDFKESQDGGQHEDPPPVAPAPSPTVPEWMPSFFTGCAENELLHLLDTFGDGLLQDARKYAENPSRRIDNPAGFVRAQLAKGWRPPITDHSRSGWRALDSFTDLADETTERLEWIISDECDWSALHRAEARRLLDARAAQKAVR